MKTPQELGREVGQAACECANAAAHFCFNRLHTELYRKLLQEKAQIYVDAVAALEACLLDAEQEAQAQEVPDTGSGDTASAPSDNGSRGAPEQLQLSLVLRGADNT